MSVFVKSSEIPYFGIESRYSLISKYIEKSKIQAKAELGSKSIDFNLIISLGLSLETLLCFPHFSSEILYSFDHSLVKFMHHKHMVWFRQQSCMAEFTQYKNAFGLRKHKFLIMVWEMSWLGLMIFLSGRKPSSMCVSLG